MGYDSNEPRDNNGKWTAKIGVLNLGHGKGTRHVHFDSSGNPISAHLGGDYVKVPLSSLTEKQINKAREKSSSHGVGLGKKSVSDHIAQQHKKADDGTKVGKIVVDGKGTRYVHFDKSGSPVSAHLGGDYTKIPVSAMTEKQIAKARQNADPSLAIPKGSRPTLRYKKIK